MPNGVVFNSLLASNMDVMTNALIHEKSPYLRGHAENPVDWQAWSAAALDRARAEDKPVFVSVGYSACHWCHVMAREAFSNTEVARLLNDNFVSIKVDREERPDLDQILQTAHQAINRRGGGWPLSVFLEPEHLTPFFAGTYFPLTPRYGMPGFAELLRLIIKAWAEQRDQVLTQGKELQALLKRQLGSDLTTTGELSLAPLRTARSNLASAYDAVNAGYGLAGPKFPQSPVLGFLVASGTAEEVPRVLEAMARRGLNDHVGGGFFRYTVDEAWSVPHFEKMLYDNAQLLGVYAEAAVRYDSGEFKAAARAVAAYLENEMRLPTGGYAASLNAESGGEEGAFYLWNREEVRNLIGADRYPAFAAAFGLDGDASVEGRWHLARINGGHGGFEDEFTQLARERDTRVRPDRDDKLLTSWNALAVTGLARAALFLGDTELAERASDLLDVLERTVVKGDQVWACAWDGQPYQPGFLEDYAYLARAALAVAAVTGGSHAVAIARRLADVILARFATESGGLAMTPVEGESLLYRPRRYADDSVPSGAGVAVQVLVMLGHLLAEPQYLDAAETALRAAWADIERAPEAHASFLRALQAFVEPPPLVVLRGNKHVINDWAFRAARTAPGSHFIQLGEDVEMAELQRYAARGDAVAYVCHGTTCSAPLDNIEELLNSLKQ
ncbi:MAG: thioredoxin domain-containing protein [Gammaproteobacteria bacterium]